MLDSDIFLRDVFSVDGSTAFGSAHTQICIIIYFETKLYPNEPRIGDHISFASVHLDGIFTLVFVRA